MSEISEILDLLMPQTDQGKIKWKLEGESLATIRQAGSILEIREVAPGTNYSFAIRNNDGIILASEYFAFNTIGFRPVKDIFEKTKRDALGVDQALKSIKNSLLNT